MGITGILLAGDSMKDCNEKYGGDLSIGLAHMMAHELKSPLSVIEGYLYILKKKSAGDNFKPQDYQVILDRCTVRLEQMRHLIDDLVALDSVEKNRHENLRVDLAKVALECVEQVQPTATEADVKVFCDVESADVAATHTELFMVISNLLGNAVKYNRPGGNVTLLVKPCGRTARLEVSDDGLGILPENLSKVFQPMWREKSAAKKDIPGTGVGLALVKKIVETLGGKIGVQSMPDKGTTFIVDLPVV